MSGVGTAQLRQRSDLLLQVEHLVVDFPVDRRRRVSAVADVSFDVAEGETLALVGESGCGKSTLALALMGLEPYRGEVSFLGQSLSELRGREARQARERMKMIFQDPSSALNPRRQVAQIVDEGFAIWGRPDDSAGRVSAALQEVGLDPSAVGGRRPHEFSGGQAQRIAIARAIVTRPALLLCDEPVSALDVSIQAQILNLLRSLRAEHRLTLLFISHKLPVVKAIADRVAVMYMGRLCEIGATERVFSEPHHPYTKALLAAAEGYTIGAPVDDPLESVETPSPIEPPTGCRYRTRCPLATEVCETDVPESRVAGPDHFVACHHSRSS